MSTSQEYPAAGYPHGSEHAGARSQRSEQSPASKVLTRFPTGYTPGRGRDRERVSPHRRERNHGCTAFRVGYRRGSSSVEPPCRFWCSSPPTSAWVVNAEYPPAHPGSGPWWESPWGWGQGRRLAPRRRRNLVTPSPQGPGAVPGHDELPEPTGRALTDCPPTWIKTVFQGDGRLTADRPIVPETDVRLLNWTVSSRVSIPNVRAYGACPPEEAFWDDLGVRRLANGRTSARVNLGCMGISRTGNYYPRQK